MNIETERESLVELSIPSRPEFLRVVRLLVSGYVSRLPVPVDEVEDIKVAVSEACNYAIHKAEGGEGRIEIRCWREGSKLCFEVSDESHGMPQRASDEAAGDEPNLGMILIQTLMDSVEIGSTGTGINNLIVMKKNIENS